MGILAKLFKKKSYVSPFLSFPRADTPIWEDWSAEKAIRDGLKASSWVYACVSRIAKLMSSVPWIVERERNNEWQEIDHPLKDLLKKANPAMSGQDLFETAAYHLELSGNAIWYVVTTGPTSKKPMELWPILPDPNIIRPIPDDNGVIVKYKYTVKGKTIELPAELVIHFKYIDPGNPHWGLGPLQAVARTVDADVEAIKWNKIALQNRAVSDGVFSFNHPITMEQYEDAKKMVRDQHQGAKNARTPWVLGNAQWHPMDRTPVEMDFLNSRKFTMNEIAAVFDVPSILLSQERPSYNNLRIAKKMFWEDKIVPMLDDLAAHINSALVRLYNEKDIAASYDISNVTALQENFGDKVTTAKVLYDMRVPFNLINQRLELGFEDIPGGDEAPAILGLSDKPSKYKATRKWTKKQAIAWLKDHDFKYGDYDYMKNYHSFRQKDPADFDRFRMDKEPFDFDEDDGVVVIWGIKDETTEIQSIRFFHGGDEDYKAVIPEEEKFQIWRKQEDLKENWESKLTDVIIELFRDEGKLVADAFKKNGVRGVDKVINERKEIWTATTRGGLRAIIEFFGQLTMQETEKASRPTRKKILFDPWAETVEKWLLVNGAKYVKNISDTSKAKIAEIVSEGLAANETTEYIATQLEQTYRNWCEPSDTDIGMSRATTIARTESGAAANYGHFEGARQTQLPLQKTWISSRDGKVRPSHDELDGFSTDLEASYPNGLMYPGDPDGEPEEILNCRCVETYNIKEGGE